MGLLKNAEKLTQKSCTLSFGNLLTCAGFQSYYYLDYKVFIYLALGKKLDNKLPGISFIELSQIRYFYKCVRKKSCNYCATLFIRLCRVPDILHHIESKMSNFQQILFVTV